LSTPRSRARIGIDVGGTFTDLVLVRADGSFLLDKTATSSKDPANGVMRGLEQLAVREDRSLRDLLATVDTIVHGTTTADDALITQSGAVVGLLTTQGHRDEIELRGGFKEDVWDPAKPPPFALCPRRRRIGVSERLDFQGNVLTSLDETALRAATQRLKKQGVESVALVFLFSFVNPVHEKRAAEIVREEWPEAALSLSHEVMPAAAEFERTSTTLVDAYIGPSVRRYVAHFEERLCEAGFRGRLLWMEANGGVMSADHVARRPVQILGSGPAGGVIGARHVASLVGIDGFVATDMGGTRYDACLVRDGAPQVRSSWSWHHRYLTGLPSLDVESIGAGGGSIAAVVAGTLTVGPQSAAADPGPICYGKGGTEPTVIDADLVLGYLDPDSFGGGGFRLQREGVEEAILEKVARPLGLSLEKAAHGIVRLVNASMADAIRRLCVRCGANLRELALVAYGGSAPIHAPMQAEELGLREVLVPRAAAVLSALGMLFAEPLTDERRSYIVPAKQIALDRVNALFGEMEATATAAFAGEGTVPFRIERYALLGYLDPCFEMAVPVTMSGARLTTVELDATLERFHRIREEMLSSPTRDQEPFLHGLRMRAHGLSKKPELARVARARVPVSVARKGRRRAYFEGGFATVPVYEGSALRAGHRIKGPAIVDEGFTTVVVNPEHRAEIDERGNYRIAFR
jgi:N-methylhydantoinase A